MPFYCLLAFLFLSISLNSCQSSKTTSSDATFLPALNEWLNNSNHTAITQTTFAQKDLSKKEALAAQKEIYKHQKHTALQQLKDSWEKKVFTWKEYELKIKVKTFGEIPKDGHSLYISMHGGGGTTPEVNDQQWENQIRLYQPKEGIYIAPRAPTDTWNLWHQHHIDELFDQLIAAAIVVANVNPNKVYLTGYSAGGDGTFQLAPRMADRFAAAAMMAGHPNETTPEGLRNLPFALYMGELDAAYDRNKKAENWKGLLDSLQNLDQEGYQHQVQLVKGMGHWMKRADTTGVQWMAQFARNPIPSKVVWKQDDRHHNNFYWLEVPAQLAQTGKRIVANYKNNTINIKESYSDTLIINLNDQMLNLDQPITVNIQGKSIFNGKIPRKVEYLWNSSERRLDDNFAFCSRLIVVNNKMVLNN